MLMMNFPTINEKPPTLYAIMNSIVNYNNDEPKKIKELANEARSTIFDFDYPIDPLMKEDFECMLLKKFMMRRIGYETVTAWQIQLEVKLNEIMPTYNKMFEAIKDWNIFSDGEVIEHTSTSTGESSSITSDNRTNTNNAHSTNDNRYAELPQNRLEDLEDGSYVTNYNLQDNISTITDTTQASGTGRQEDETTIEETTSRTLANKIDAYNNFVEKRNHIYTMIFKDLEVLFYSLI